MATNFLDALDKQLEGYTAFDKTIDRSTGVPASQPGQQPAPQLTDPDAPKPKIAHTDDFDAYLERQLKARQAAKAPPSLTPEQKDKIKTNAHSAMDVVGMDVLPKGIQEWANHSELGMAIGAGQATDVSGLIWANRLDTLRKTGKDLPPETLKYLKTVEDLAAFQTLVNDDERGLASKLLLNAAQFGGQMTQSSVLTGKLNPTIAGLTAGTGVMLRNIPAMAANPALVGPSIAQAMTGAAMAGAATSALHTYLVEKGGAFQELSTLKNSKTGKVIPLQSAMLGAELVGNINAGIEMMNLPLVFKMIPGLSGVKMLTGKGLTTALKKSPTFVEFLSKWGGRWAAGTSSEIAQEVAQELTNIVAETILSDKKVSKIADDPANRERIKNIALQTAMGVGTLGAFGAGMNARGEWKSVLADREQGQQDLSIRLAQEKYQKFLGELSQDPVQGPPTRQRPLPWVELNPEQQQEQVPGAPQQMELPGMGGPQPPPAVPPTPPAPPVAPVAPDGSVTPVPAATVGPELAPPATTVEPPLPIQTLEQRLAALRQAQSATPEANAGPPAAPPIPPTPPVATPEAAVPVLTKQVESKIELDDKPKTFDENGAVANKKPINYYEVQNPEVYADKHFVQPAVLLRDGTVIKGDVPHLPFGPNNATKEAQESYDAAQRALVQKLMDMGIQKEQIAFDHNERLDKWLPAFGWVVPTPEHGDQKVPTFISNSQRDNAKDFGDKLHQSQFKDKTPVSKREETDAKRAAKQAAKGEGATVEGTTDLVAPTGTSALEKEHSQIVRSISKKTEKALLRKRPGLTGTNIGFNAQNTNANEVSSAVNAIVAELAAKVDRETQGMPKAERRKIFLKTLNDKLEGLAINKLAESQGKRRETEQKMKEGTLSSIAMDKENQGSETTGGALVNALSSDGTLNIKEPKVNLGVEDVGRVAPVKTLTPEKAGVAPTERRTLTKEQKVALEKRDNKLLNQYFGYRFNSKRPEVRAARIAMTPAQIFERFQQAPDPKYKWGPRAVADVQKAAVRAGYDLNATTDPRKRGNAKEATLEAQGSTIIEKANEGTPPAPIAGSLASGKAEIKNMLQKEAQDRRIRGYVQRTRPEVDALKGTATAQIVLEARQNEQLFTRPDGTDKFEKFAPASSQAEKIGGTVLPATDGQYVVHVDPFGRVQHDITVREGELAKRQEPTPEKKIGKSVQDLKDMRAKELSTRKLDVRSAKQELDPVYDLLKHPKFKNKRKVNITEHNLQSGQPAEIHPTWHDGVYRFTVLKDEQGNLTEGRSGSYDSIMMEGQVAGAKSGPLRPGTTLYIVDAGPYPNQISSVDIFRTAPGTRALPTAPTQKQLAAPAKAPLPAQITEVKTISNPTTTTATPENVLAAIDEAATQSASEPKVAPIPKTVASGPQVSDEAKAKRLAGLEKARAAKQANAKVREAAKAAAATTMDMASTIGDIMAIVNKGSSNTLSALAPLSDLDAAKIAALKPHFSKLWDQSKQLGWDVKQFVAEVIKMIGAPAIPYFRHWANTDLKDIIKAGASIPSVAQVSAEVSRDLGATPVPARTALDMYNETKTQKALAKAEAPVIPPTKADRMAKPRHVGKNKEFNDAIWDNFREAVELAGLNASLLQKQLQKYGVDKNKLVTKANGDVVYTGLQGIVFGRAKNPDIADGLIFPVGDDQYIIFKPEQPGVTPSMLDIVTEASMHNPLPEYEAPVSKQAPKVGGGVPKGPTAAELKGSFAEVDEMEEALSKMDPEQAAKVREMINAPLPESKVIPLKNPAPMLEHMSASNKSVPVNRRSEFRQWMKDSGISMIKYDSNEFAWRMRQDGERVVQLGDKDYTIVTYGQMANWDKGQLWKAPPVQSMMARAKEDEQRLRDQAKKYGIQHNPTPVVDTTLPPMAQKVNMMALNERDLVAAQQTSMHEATLISGNGGIMLVMNNKKEDKTAFLTKVRDTGKQMGAVKVVISESIDGKPSKNHQVTSVKTMPVTPQALSKFVYGESLQNQRGESALFNDFVVTFPLHVWKSLNESYHSMAAYFDVEAPWKRKGLPEIGFTIKSYFSTRDAQERRGMELAQKIMKIIHTSFKGQQTKDDLLNIVLATERTGKMWDGTKLVEAPFSDEWLAKAQPAITMLRKYFDDTQAEFAARGVKLDFVGNQIARLQSKIDELNPDKKNYETKKAGYEELIKSMRGLQFVHIPYRMLFATKLKEYIATTNAERARQKMTELRTIINRNRLSPTLAKLLEVDKDGETHIDPHDINPAMVIMNYAQNKGIEHAMLDIRDSVKMYGDAVVRVADSRPVEKDYSWQTLPGNMKILETLIPESQKKTHDVYVRTDLVEALTNAMSFGQQVGKWRTTLAWIKLAAFYNPVMLPAYNFVQLWMGGLVNPRHWHPIKSLKDIGGVQAFAGRQYGTRSSDYWNMADNAGTSQPFANPHEDIQAMTKQVASMKGNVPSQIVRGLVENFMSRMDTAWKESALPIKPVAPVKAFLSMFYNTLSHMAWIGDEYTRMLAYNYLKDKGHTPRDAAQLTAMMLGDYAGVPSSTRRSLNQVLFTPSYKISMMKFWGQMVKAALTPQAWGSMIDSSKYPQYKKERRYIYGMISTAAMSWVIRNSMEAFGYKEDQYLRRWLKRMATKDGMKEFVVTWASPANLLSKYFYKLKDVMMGDPGSLDPMMVRLARMAVMELHPLWQAAYQLAIENKTIGGEQIFHPFDAMNTREGVVENVKNGLGYAATVLAPVIPYLYGTTTGKIPFEGQSQRMARDVFTRDSGKFMNFVQEAIAFRYMREAPEKRLKYKMDQLSRELPKQLTKEFQSTGKIRRDWIKNYEYRVRESLSNFYNEKK